MIINKENPNEARKEIEKASKTGLVVVQGRSIDYNRLILENKKVDMLILSHTNKKDKLKQRDSGLNHVLCNLARENNIILAMDIQEINGDKKDKALILARWIQNIKLIKKAKCKIKLLNYSNKIQAFSLLLSMGLDTNKAKQALI